MLSHINITRILIVICVLFYTGIAGLFEAEQLIFFGFPLSDLSILIVILYAIYSYRLYGNWGDHKILSAIKIIIFLTTVVVLSMPLRGNETLIQGFQTGRRFYILLLSIMVIDNVRLEGNTEYIRKMLILFGIYYSILAILNYIFPGITTAVWKGIGSLSDFKGIVERHVLKANEGLLLIHLSFLVKSFSILSNETERRLKDFLLCGFLALSVFCMGYRAMMMATFASFFIILFVIRRSLFEYGLMDNSKLINFGFGIVLTLAVADFLLDNAISGTIMFANGEITGENTGTLAGRLNRSMVYQIPMLLKSPLFGYGFVSVHSQMAQDLGYIRIVDYSRSLYYFDFGYGTLFVMFGLVGGIIFLYSLLRCTKGCIIQFDDYPSENYLTCAGFIIALLLCNYSFGALEYGIGLLPLGIIIGCAAGQSLLYEDDEESLENEDEYT